MQSTGLCKLTASGARVGICDAMGTCLPCIPLFSFLNETRGPMSYGRKQEGGRRTRTVRSYAHRPHPHYDSPWFSFFFFCFAELTFIILVVCCGPRLAAPGPQMNISERRPTSEVNVISFSNIRTRNPSSRVDIGLVLFDERHAAHRSLTVCVPYSRNS